MDQSELFFLDCLTPKKCNIICYNVTNCSPSRTQHNVPEDVNPQQHCCAMITSYLLLDLLWSLCQTVGCTWSDGLLERANLKHRTSLFLWTHHWSWHPTSSADVRKRSLFPNHYFLFIIPHEEQKWHPVMPFNMPLSDLLRIQYGKHLHFDTVIFLHSSIYDT